MKLATITRLAVCAAMLCLVGSYTVPVGALPTDEIERYFYSGCTSPVEIGYFDLSCSGHVFTSGQQSGDWKEVYTWPCESGTPTYNVYEWCTDHWRNADFLGDCRCDHP